MKTISNTYYFVYPSEVGPLTVYPTTITGHDFVLNKNICKSERTENHRLLDTELFDSRQEALDSIPNQS